MVSRRNGIRKSVITIARRKVLVIQPAEICIHSRTRFAGPDTQLIRGVDLDVEGHTLIGDIEDQRPL